MNWILTAKTFRREIKTVLLIDTIISFDNYFLINLELTFVAQKVINSLHIIYNMKVLELKN